MLNVDKYAVLTFDCYGTLIDWESGILKALLPVLERHGVRVRDEKILELYASFESEAEMGLYIPYREVLRSVVWKFGKTFEFVPDVSEENALVDSVQYWQPFSDTVEALRTLEKRYKLAVISNIDDDLFAGTAKHLQVDFDYIITAEQVQSYKPSTRNFTYAIEKIGLSKENILHTAQSLYHDIAPAKSLGLTTVWVNRRAGQVGSGATPPEAVEPDLEVPDLKALVIEMGLQSK